MTLHQLKIFATVAKLRSFTRAAEHWRVSQPAISLLVKGLERELEVKLFEKLGNKVRLTVAGERLLHHAGELLAKVDRVKEEVDELKGLRKAKLFVGGSVLAAASFLPGAVQRFKKEHPGVEVILKIQRSESLEQKLLEGELDLAIMGRVPHSPLLRGRPYREEELVVIAPPKHPLSKRRSVPLELIAKEPLIAQEKGTRLRDLVEQRFAERGLPFAPVLEVDVQFGARDTIKRAVAQNLGLGFVSRPHVVGDAEAGRVKILKVPELKVKTTMYVAVHKNRQNLPLVQGFVDFLRHFKC